MKNIEKFHSEAFSGQRSKFATYYWNLIVIVLAIFL